MRFMMDCGGENRPEDRSEADKAILGRAGVKRCQENVPKCKQTQVAVQPAAGRAAHNCPRRFTALSISAL